ncbi:phage portal protein [Kibdelosporangium philippinense]|uniref:Phage portal protein n=1 Tax=Kibdelosporangium philippinense TaxID=211113 RepID=A0ABS8ZMJ3_9PSEU|nr:phage portal protein [Kibdelosporangium philippinense]MCE7008737.1 phage portal protein [Kibdelosporangium philippinense]
MTDLIPQRMPSGKAGKVRVTNDTAMRHSAVWACLRLRADLISTMPIDAYRMLGDIQIEVTKPPVLISPGGARVKVHEWMYSSQVDLDRAGNVFGLITARDGLGLPARVELQDLAYTSVQIRDGEIETYRFRGKTYLPHEVWHEKQFTLAGLPIGLSPTSYAAYTIQQYLSAQQFALDWFGGGAIPAAELKNTAKTITPKESEDIKSRFKATVGPGDVFVHGSDWEYKPLQAIQSDAMWINTQEHGIPDIARFFGCPADLIDAAVSGQSVTYASISQRNLQLLIMNLGPAVFRRETALSDLLPKPRFVKLNSDAIMRMDPETRAKMLGQQIRDRMLAPSEARALQNRQPFTDEQLSEFDRLFGAPKTTPTIAATGATS